jgi:cysteine desulfurase
MIYLDHHATTPCDPRVVSAMLPWFTDAFGNAGSVEHEMGRAAARAVEAARDEVAALIGAEPAEIIFTSGATESNNLAILGAARFARKMGDRRQRVITLATEHHAVLDPVAALAEEGFEPVVLPVRPDGLLDPAVLAEALREPTLLVSIMAVNNEIGVLQDLALLGPMVKAAGASLHVDAAQAAGRVPLDVSVLKADLLSLSAHKMYGPKGIGALYVRRRPRMRISPLMAGGGQERGLRSGTLPVPPIIGMGEAARLARAEGAAESARLRQMAARLHALLAAEIAGLTLNGHAERRVAGSLNLTFPAGSARALLAEAPDLCLSSSSACTSGPDGGVGASHVLTALGLAPEAARRSLRIGLGRFTCEAEIATAAQALGAAARRMGAAAAA